MKYILKISVLIILLTSCGESFKHIDTTKFNSKIQNRNDIKTPEELIEIFYDYPENEGNPKLKITCKKLDKNKFEITLIHDHLEDDSQSAVKYVMIAIKNGDMWKALEVKENWKCSNGRGHTSWGTGYCN